MAAAHSVPLPSASAAARRSPRNALGHLPRHRFALAAALTSIAAAAGLLALPPAAVAAIAACAVLVPLSARYVEQLVVGWIALLCIAPHGVTHIRVGPLYLTEVVLAFLLGAVALRALTTTPTAPRARAAALRLVAMILVPATLALVARTQLTGLTWAQNFALAYYCVFVLVPVQLRADGAFFSRLFAGIVAGAVIAFALVSSGATGGSYNIVTSTGALRLAHTSYVLPFGIAPLCIAAALCERVASRWLLAPAAVSLIGLVLMNYRSTWLAFAAALAVVMWGRLRKAIVVLALTVGVAIAAVAWSNVAFPGGATVKSELARARTVVDTGDPNAQYRLVYWRSLVASSVSDPVLGHGFDAYPAALQAPHAATFVGGVQVFDFQPHNSFVALGYRIGLLPSLVVLLALTRLVLRAVRRARCERDPRTRALLRGTAATVLYVAGYSFFNVGLETPYTASLFWLAVGVLIVLLARPAAPTLGAETA